MNAWIGRERSTTFSDRRLAQRQKLIQAGKLGLKVLPQCAFGISRHIALRQVKSEGRYRGDHQHHGGGEFCPISGDPALVWFARSVHGKSKCVVSPFFNSTV